MGCRFVLRAVIGFLVVEAIIAAVLMGVEAPILVVIGGAVAYMLVFLWFMANWVFRSSAEVVGPTQPRLNAGPSPLAYVLQPLYVLLGLVAFFAIIAAFLSLDPPVQRQLLTSLGALLVNILTTLGNLARAVLQSVRSGLIRGLADQVYACVGIRSA